MLFEQAIFVPGGLQRPGAWCHLVAEPVGLGQCGARLRRAAGGQWHLDMVTYMESHHFKRYNYRWAIYLIYVKLPEGGKWEMGIIYIYYNVLTGPHIYI